MSSYSPERSRPSYSTSPTSTLASRSKRREIVVLGFRGVGKSSITIQFVENTWVETYYPTIENTFEKNMNFRGEPIALQILDTTGQDELTIFSPRHMVGIHGYLLVYDVTSRQSFRVVQHIYDKICNAFLGDTTNRYIPIVLVGNKCDLDHDRAVTCEEGRQLAQEWQCAFIEVSAKHDENIKAAFHQLLQQVQENEEPEPENKSLCNKICTCCCCGEDTFNNTFEKPPPDQNGSLMGSPVIGRRGRFRRSHHPNRKRSRASSAASDYFLSYDGQRNIEPGTCDGKPGCCDEENGCCVVCCTLSTKAQTLLYYLVGIFAILMFIVGICSMITGFQIAVQENGVPIIPNHRNGTTNSTTPTPSPMSFSSTIVTSIQDTQNAHYEQHEHHEQHKPNERDKQYYHSRNQSVTQRDTNTSFDSSPIPWNPVKPANLHGAWEAYGAIGLGLYTIVISLVGLRGMQRLNKDMIRLFSCSAGLDLIVHVGTFVTFLIYPNLRPKYNWSTITHLSQFVIIPILFAIEFAATISSFILQFNLLGTEDENALEHEDADHPYLVSSFDESSQVNSSSGWGGAAYLADDELGARRLHASNSGTMNDYGSTSRNSRRNGRNGRNGGGGFF